MDKRKRKRGGRNRKSNIESKRKRKEKKDMEKRKRNKKRGKKIKKIIIKIKNKRLFHAKYLRKELYLSKTFICLVDLLTALCFLVIFLFVLIGFFLSGS